MRADPAFDTDVVETPAAGVEFSIATLVETTAQRVPDRPAIVADGTAFSYAELVDRSRRLARYLTDHGLGAHRERAELAGHESGQDLMAQYLHNGVEYLEGLIGAFRGRVAPFNVNHRYVADELRNLLRNARPAAIQFHACFAPVLAEVLTDLPTAPLLLQVEDGSGEPLLPGAVDYEQALGSVSPQVDVVVAPDDLYVLYTGGTTGMPKGVLWRQADVVVAALGVRNRRADREWTALDERLAAIPRRPQRVMPLAPYMHGAAQWFALQALCEGNTVVLPSQPRRFDPDDAWDTAARHGVTMISIVGDAFARPLADAIEARPRDLPALQYLFSGGAALSTIHRRRLTTALPHLTVTETIGSSESGTQGRSADDSAADHGATARTFAPGPGTVVLDEDLRGALTPGHTGTGWLATGGRIPLGYLGDAAKTARTFPVVDGRRLTVPGDRARLHADGRVELLGRDATTVNSGGEKIFVEEVEAAVKAHPGVADAVVCGRPSARWGSEVVALVEPRPGIVLDPDAVLATCAEHVARYKVPKALHIVDGVRRTPAGKSDLRWATELAARLAEPRGSDA
ncbi:AMP-binding protein [Pseudonocardia sp. GCM10023141]|uniref:AMP-binding protein n=1 Tax=Pseudonocardia sp. GCM10023141 TaxID=3252653 RepID=UPI003610AA31